MLTAQISASLIPGGLTRGGGVALRTAEMGEKVGKQPQNGPQMAPMGGGGDPNRGVPPPQILTGQHGLPKFVPVVAGPIAGPNGHFYGAGEGFGVRQRRVLPGKGVPYKWGRGAYGVPGVTWGDPTEGDLRGPDGI